jgi:Abortive infection alpha
MAIATDEEAKAVQKVAEFGSTAITEVGQLARYAGKVLGTVTEDLVGIVLGEPLRYIRTVIAEKIDIRVEEIHRSRNVENLLPVTPSLAIPLLQAAYDEGRPELQELWARLIAAAMDPSREGRIRLSFIATLKQFDPMDARVLERMSAVSGGASPNMRDFLASVLTTSTDEIMLSAFNLIDLKCLGWSPQGAIGGANFHITVYGRALLRACFD